MALGDGILDCLGLGNELALCPFKITVYGEKGVLICGIKKLIKICNDELSFFTTNKKISISGENLKITSYGEKEVAVTGKIYNINVENGGGRVF